MAVLRNTIVNGNIQNIGHLATKTLSVDGIDTSILNGNISGNETSTGLVSAYQVSRYIDSQLIVKVFDYRS